MLTTTLQRGIKAWLFTITPSELGKLIQVLTLNFPSFSESFVKYQEAPPATQKTHKDIVSLYGRVHALLRDLPDDKELNKDTELTPSQRSFLHEIQDIYKRMEQEDDEMIDNLKKRSKKFSDENSSTSPLETPIKTAAQESLVISCPSGNTHSETIQCG